MNRYTNDQIRRVLRLGNVFNSLPQALKRAGDCRCGESAYTRRPTALLLGASCRRVETVRCAGCLRILAVRQQGSFYAIDGGGKES